MKNKLTYLLLLVICTSFSFVACSDDDKDDSTSVAKELIVDNSSVTLLQNDEIEIAINSGNGGYGVKVVDEKIASASVSDNKVIIKSVGDIGETNIIVFDSRKKTTQVKVRVGKLWELTVSDNEPKLFMGEQVLMKIETGNGGYQIELAEGGEEFVSLGTLNGQTFTIKALAFGTATINITDKKEQSTQVIVTVSPTELELEKYEATLTDPDQVAKVQILGGNGGYTFSYDVEGIVEATEQNNEISIKGLKPGTVEVIVTDEEGESKSIQVTVHPFEIQLDVKSIFVRGSKASTIINIVKGNGDYTISPISDAYYTATLDGTKITIEAKKVGISSLKITDAVGKELDVLVNIASAGMNLALDYCMIANYDDLSNKSNYTNLSQVTFEVFVKISGVRGLQGFIGLEGNLLLRGRYDDYHKGNKQAIEFVSKLDNTESKLVTQPFMKVEKDGGSWHHMALVFDGTQADKKERHKLYVDGELYTDFDGSKFIESDRTTVDLTKTGNAPGLGIGRVGEGEHRGLNGYLSEARIWTVARTPAQIKGAVCELSATDNNGLLSHWKFDSGVAIDEVEDLAGNWKASVYNNKAGSVSNKITFPADRWIDYTCPIK